MLVQDLHEPIIDPQAKEKKVSFVVNYFVNNRNMHTMYAIKFFVCEVLNLINVFCQFVRYLLIENTEISLELCLAMTFPRFGRHL